MKIGIATILALVLMTCAADAKPIPAGGLTIGDVVGWLQEAGYRAQIAHESSGKSYVQSATGGTDFGVYMFDCKKDRCGSIQFAAGFATHGKFDIHHMNDWNRDQRWARGYYDSVNDPWIEMDVDLTPGGSYELLNDELAIWDGMLGAFKTRYGLK